MNKEWDNVDTRLWRQLCVKWAKNMKEIIKLCFLLLCEAWLRHISEYEGTIASTDLILGNFSSLHHHNTDIPLGRGLKQTIPLNGNISSICNLTLYTCLSTYNGHWAGMKPNTTPSYLLFIYLYYLWYLLPFSILPWKKLFLTCIDSAKKAASLPRGME